MADAMPDEGGRRGRRDRSDAPRREVPRELPHNLELEKAVLAVLLDGRHATAMHKVRALVEHPLGFFHRDHRMVYLACLELDDQGHRVDGQSVAELLSRYPFQAMLERLRKQQMLLDGDQLDALGRARLKELWRREQDETAAPEDSALAAMGGFSAIDDLMEAFGAAANLDRNVVLLWDYHLKRRYITRLQTLCDKAYRTTDEFPRLVDEGNQTMLDLGKGSKTSNVVGISEAVDETRDAIQKASENADAGVRTGIPELDDRLMSLRPGGLYILAARPGVGKTSFALKVVSNIAGHTDTPTGALFFSLEVDRVDLVRKLISAEAGVEFRGLETGNLEAHEVELVADTTTRLKAWSLDLMDVSDLTVAGLRSVVKRRMLETNGKLRVVVIDYLQLLGSTRPDHSEYEKISEISRVLKILARELRIPVVALSQMSRDSEKGAGNASREPRLSDLRGSGSIEQDADAVIFLHRSDTNDGSRPDTVRKIKVVIAKNRFGPTGAFAMDFFPAKMRFAPAALDEPEEHETVTHERTVRKDRFQTAPAGEEDLFG